MRSRSRVLTLLALAALGFLAGCPFEDRDDSNKALLVLIQADAETTSPLEPVELTVTAWNRGNSTIAWGEGSSGCQLHALAFEGRYAHRVVDKRVCVTDIVTHRLGPGEIRTGRWEWDGRVTDRMETRFLPPGRYEIRGAAGSWTSNNFVTIEVTATIQRLDP